MKARWEMVGALVLAFVAAPVLAIDLGDPAPPLKIKEWVKGQPVNLKEAKGKNIVVVEFWATWCGPCKQSIPHLTELQKKFKDQGVVFIGISDETTDKVKPFVEKMGKDMDYVVALDDDQATNKAYMQAFKVNGIPHAFIVDKAGAIVWSDHPMAGMEEALEEIIAGKYDIEAAKNHAIGEIHTYAADLATSVAEKILRRNLNPEDQKDLVRSSLEQLQNVAKN